MFSSMYVIFTYLMIISSYNKYYVRHKYLLVQGQKLIAEVLRYRDKQNDQISLENREITTYQEQM